MKMIAPIILFVYNRPIHTKLVIEALLKNELANRTSLIIYSDGPKRESHVEAVRNVRAIIHQIKGFSNIEIIERGKNIGLADSIISGVDEIFNKYDQTIVLEDDLIASPYFLQYMNDSLTLYSDKEKVASIHGYSYPVQHQMPDTFFLKGADCWGWGTWKRAWKTFERNPLVLLSQLVKDDLINKFDYNGTVNNYKMLRKQAAGKIDSWAIRWHASCFLQNMFTLYPGKSLIKNIGNDQTGTHTRVTHAFDVDIANESFSLVEIKVEEKQEILNNVESYFKSIRMNYLQKLIYVVKNRTL